MQLLMKSSDEFGKYKGLSLINGKVISLEKMKIFQFLILDGPLLKLKKKNENKIISEIKDKVIFYFIHSFKVLVEENDNSVCTTNYGSNKFCSVVNSANIFGTQFHPEKSGRVGEKLIQNFLDL